MPFLGELEERILVLDGAMGTLIQKSGVSHSCPEELYLTTPELISSIHRQYLDAGADVIETNTFGATTYKLKEFGLQEKAREINEIAVSIAKRAAKNTALVAASIGPLGEYVKPLGKLSFDEAYSIYKKQIRALKKADIFLIETISDIKIAKAAIIAAKEVTSKPIICSFAFEDGRTATGTDTETAATIVEALGVDVIGLNCCAGPKELYSTAKKIAESTDLPILAYPNAGLPYLVNGRTVFPLGPNSFVREIEKFLELGVNIVGGCCGTTPFHIRLLAQRVKGKKPVKRKNSKKSKLCSRTKTVVIEKPTIVGECINPTNKKDLIEEIKHKKISIIKRLAIEQSNAGTALLDLNVSIANGNDKKFLPIALNAVESCTDSAIVLDNTDPVALENALKVASGKVLINSVNGKKESIENLLPLAKKYGAAIIGLTLDENGIPESAEKRVEIAKKIIAEANRQGITREDIYIDCITSTVAAEREKAKITIEALEEIKKLGVKTTLGISNISIGLPNRREINFRFLCQALNAGLDLAIVNPLDEMMKDAIESYSKFDSSESLDKYVDKLIKIEKKPIDKKLSIDKQLEFAVMNGLEEDIEKIVEEALQKYKPLEVNNFLLQGMSIVGEKFKKKEIFLPNVMLSASTMKKAFAVIKKHLKSGTMKKKGKIIFATVKNDVHDIGKNIVIALLESNGYEIVDLGKDVDEKRIVKEVKENNASLICLSSLMTTTMIEMPKVIEKLRKNGFNIPVMVGGAVVNKEFAKDIGASYGKDAVDAVEKVKEISTRVRW